MITSNPFITSLYKGRIYVSTTNGSKYPFYDVSFFSALVDADTLNKVRKYGYDVSYIKDDPELLYYVFTSFRGLGDIGTTVIDYANVIDGDTFTILGPATPVTFDTTTITVSITDEEKAEYAADEFGNDFVIHMNNILKNTPATSSDSNVGDFCEFFLFDKQQIGLKFKNEYIDPAGVATCTIADTAGVTLGTGFSFAGAGGGPIGITDSNMYSDYAALVALLPTDLQFYVHNSGTTVDPSFSEVYIQGEHISGIIADVVRYPENFRIR